MKSLTQKVALVAAVVVVVFVVAFLAQFNFGGLPPDPPKQLDGKKGGANIETAKNDNDQPFFFAERDPVGKGLSLRAECEFRSAGHYDFFFRNPNDASYTFGLESKSCTCTTVKGGVLAKSGFVDADGWKRFEDFGARALMTQLASGTAPLLDRVVLASAVTHRLHGLLSEKLEWVELEKTVNGVTGPGLTLPPGGVGVVRMHWKASERATSPEQRLVVDLWRMTPTGSRAVDPHIEVLVAFVPPVWVEPTSKDLEPMEANEKRTAVFEVWSPTRPDFALEAAETRGDPCFKCSMEKMTTAECEDLSVRKSIRIASGYRLTVTVSEPADKSGQLDLGPFSRRIELKSSALAEPTLLYLTGEVKGLLDIGSEEKGRITFKQFSIANGAKKEVLIRSEQSGLKLEVERIDPPALARMIDVKLQDKGASSGAASAWLMQVVVPPNRAKEGFPETGAIYLKATGQSVRRVRIPVSGQAFQAAGAGF
jgi:hypothetical protein